MRIACITTHLPYAKIPHAGGRFSFAWLSTLSSSADIDLIVPATPGNVSAPRELPPNIRISLVEIAGRRSRIASLYHYQTHGGVTPGLSELSALRGSDRLAAAVSAADVVEIHWQHLLPLLPDIRRLAGQVPVAAIVHDVMSDKSIHEARSAVGLRQRAGSFYRATRAARVEAGLLNGLDHVLTFSRKDVTLLENLGVRTQMDVIDPPVRVPDEPARPPDEPVVTFTGAMARPANSRSVIWFLDSVWPAVEASVPAAKLVVAGADPPDALLRRRSATVRVTGYVDDLDAVYHGSSLFVAPLVFGAGVKFKVLDAMAHGLPVVATPLAAEGIVEEAGSSSFGAITADPLVMAERIAQLLRDSAEASTVGRAARAWVQGRYDFERSSRRALASYTRLAMAGAA